MNVMCKKIGAKLLAPSRCTQLAESEEAARAELTWQQMDERIYLAGCAEGKVLQDWGADLQQFITDREKTWLVFSDQVPIWIKIGILKILYSAAELAEKGFAAKKAVKDARKTFNATHGKDSQKLAPAAAEEKQGGEEEEEEEEGCHMWRFSFLLR